MTWSKKRLKKPLENPRRESTRHSSASTTLETWSCPTFSRHGEFECQFKGILLCQLVSAQRLCANWRLKPTRLRKHQIIEVGLGQPGWCAEETTVWSIWFHTKFGIDTIRCRGKDKPGGPCMMQKPLHPGCKLLCYDLSIHIKGCLLVSHDGQTVFKASTIMAPRNIFGVKLAPANCS